MRPLNSLDPKWKIYIISFPKTQGPSQKRVAKKGQKDCKSRRKQRTAVGKGFLIMTGHWTHGFTEAVNVGLAMPGSNPPKFPAKKLLAVGCWWWLEWKHIEFGLW